MFGPDFYPTPRHIASKMLAKISSDAYNFLEPSAGKGDLAQAIRDADQYRRSRKIDCIESSPELAAALASKDFPVVGFDWLAYTGVCYYDAIVMNPPFSAGAEHLLRAWDFLHDGEIVCLLNQETIDNPCNAERQRLQKIIAEHGNVEALGPCFSRGAERATGANVAMVYLKKVSDDDRIDLWATEPGTEREPDGDINSPDNMLAIRDRLGNLQHYYDSANEHFLKALQHLRKAALFMDANGITINQDYEHMAGIAMRNVNNARAEFARKHRRDAWMNVFKLTQFHRWLDRKQSDQFIRDIETNGNIPFTADNIKGTLENVLSQRGRLFEQSVANVFDELTRYFNGNTNHTEGWKSNDSYKVNLKLVFPWGCEFSYGSFSMAWGRGVIDVYNDLDRILAVFDKKTLDRVYSVQGALQNAFRNCRTPGTCESEYFEIRYFKKGTIHLKWKRRDLWEQFNITAAAGKKWVGENTQRGAA